MKVIDYIISYFNLLKEIHLTSAEARVLFNLYRGLSVVEIAEQTHRSINTIRKQITCLHEKFNVRTNTQLLLKIIQEVG